MKTMLFFQPAEQTTTGTPYPAPFRKDLFPGKNRADFRM
jgi:hypothetical protein